MTRFAKVTIPFALLLLLGLIAGCGSDGDPTVAAVGDYDIKLSEYRLFLSQANMSFATADEEFAYKRDLLDSVVAKRLLIQAAYERGIDESEEIARVVLANKDQFLLDALYKLEIADKAEKMVSDAEVRHYWEMLANQVHFSHILVDNLDTANALVDRLMNGENFEQLAYDYSIDPSAKRNRGDIGYNTWGALVDEFQDAGFQMDVGEVSPPVKTQFGYHIIRVLDKQPNEARKPFDESKETVRTAVLERAKRKLLTEFMESVKEQYVVTVDSTVSAYVMHKREELYPPQVLATLPRSDFDVEQLDRNERELVLATWEGGQITLYEYLTDIKPLRMELRPDLDDVDSLETIIYTMRLNDFLILEANKMGIENDPDFKRKLKLYKELNMAEVMENDSLPKPPVPDEASIRRYYEDHINDYSDPAEIQVFEILVSDEMLANKLAKEIKTLEEFKEKAMDLTERPAKRASNGDLGYIQERWFPEIFAAADKTPVGSIGGPVVTSDNKYSVIWVTDKIAANPKDYLEVKSAIAQKMMDEQKAEALRLWVDARKEITPVEVNESTLWDMIDRSKYETPQS